MTKNELKTFAESALPALYDLAPVQIAPESALLGVQSEIEELLTLNQPEVMKDRFGFFQVPHSTERDYEERFFEIGPDEKVLAGIRHLNGAKEQPFVHVFLGFTPTPADLSILKDLARRNFSVFSPKHLGLWLRPSSDCARILEKEGLAARRYMMGRIQNLIQTTPPPGYDRIKLEVVMGTFDYAWYETACQEFHAANPELRSWVPLTDREDLQKCARENLLFCAKIDGALAGVIGAYSEPLLGSQAVYMTEILLTRSFKGQGLATALQRKFLESVPPQYELVWGTIDAKNLPSTKTALKIGRVPIRAEYFLPLD